MVTPLTLLVLLLSQLQLASEPNPINWTMMMRTAKGMWMWGRQEGQRQADRLSNGRKDTGCYDGHTIMYMYLTESRSGACHHLPWLDLLPDPSTATTTTTSTTWLSIMAHDPCRFDSARIAVWAVVAATDDATTSWLFLEIIYNNNNNINVNLPRLITVINIFQLCLLPLLHVCPGLQNSS